MFLKYLLRFFNEYWDILEYVEPESLSVALGESAESSSSESGSSVSAASVNFFLFFGVWDDFEIFLAISQMNTGIWRL